MLQLNTHDRCYKVYEVLTKAGNHLEATPEQILRMLIHETLPFSIKAKDTKSILQAELVRFPFSINGLWNFEVYSCRLMPHVGQIQKVELHEDHHLEVGELTFSEECVTVQLNKGLLYLEIYFQQPTEKLPKLQPPLGYRENIIVQR